MNPIQEILDDLEKLKYYGVEITPREIFDEVFFHSTLGMALRVVPAIILVGTVYWFIRRAWHKKKLGADFKELRRKCRLNEIVRLLLVCWITGIVTFVIMPDNFWRDFWYLVLRKIEPTSTYNWSYDIHAFKFRSDMISALLGNRNDEWLSFMLFGNMALFAPLGLALPFVWRRGNFPRTLLAGVSCSLVVELVQPFFSRSFDVDDIICNAAGVTIGYLLFFCIRLLFPKFVEKCRTSIKVKK